MDHQSQLIEAANRADAAFTNGDARTLAVQIANQCGLSGFASVMSRGKGVALLGDVVLKTGNANQIAESIKCAAMLGDLYAPIIAHGNRWMIQRRVSPIADAREFARTCLALGVCDTRRNSGIDSTGRMVAFDGFARLNQRPKA